MDRSHEDYVEKMLQDPTIDKEKFKELNCDNYTNSLAKMRMDVNFDDTDDDAYKKDGLTIELSEELDATDKKRVK